VSLGHLGNRIKAHVNNEPLYSRWSRICCCESTTSPTSAVCRAAGARCSARGASDDRASSSPAHGSPASRVLASFRLDQAARHRKRTVLLHRWVISTGSKEIRLGSTEIRLGSTEIRLGINRDSTELGSTDYTSFRNQLTHFPFLSCSDTNQNPPQVTWNAPPEATFAPPPGPPPAEPMVPRGWSIEEDPVYCLHYYVNTLVDPPQAQWEPPAEVMAQAPPMYSN